MKQTVIRIQQKAITIHEYIIDGVATEEQLERVVADIENLDHPDDIIGTINDAGLKVADYNHEGCYEESEFEYLEDCIREAEE